MTLPALPTLDVYIAFNPSSLTTANQNALPASGTSNAYWTNCTAYVLDFQTRSGRQHFLDRIESSTLNLTVNARDGFFLNGSVNGTGFVIQPRLPIAVTATWLGTTYPVYWGLTESIEERNTDALNSELRINASDLMKYLSLRYMVSNNFWKTYAQTPNVRSWWTCDLTNNAVITSGSGGGTSATYHGTNTFHVGDVVTISGFSIKTGVTLNVSQVTITVANSGAFTVALPASIASSTTDGTGFAYIATSPDVIAGAIAQYAGTVSFQPHGALIYDSSGSVDLANGGTSATGTMQLPAILTTNNAGALDFWVIGQSIANVYMAEVSNGSYGLMLIVGADGSLTLEVNLGGSVVATIDTMNTYGAPAVNDGFWHHVGIAQGPSGYLEIYLDGQFYAITGYNFSGGFNTYDATSGITYPLAIGGFTNVSPRMAAYVDEVIISNLSYSYVEIINRYAAGTILQKQTLSGNRIAEILTIAGFGSIVNGAIVLNANLFYCNNSPTPWVFNGYGSCQVEPYYWDTPVTNYTALDLILQVCDTDIGAFFQRPDGTFMVYNQLFYGVWSWSGTSGTWTTTYTTPSGDHIWTDDGSGYPYVGVGLQVLRDDADVWTTVKITPQAGAEQVYENTGAEPRWGYSTLLKSSTVPISLNAALSTANYLGYLFRSPLPRVGNVTLTAEAGNGAYMTALFDCRLGDPITFKRTSSNASTSGTYPSNMGQINTNMIVESVSHDFQADPGQWHTSFVLDPYPVRA